MIARYNPVNGGRGGVSIMHSYTLDPDEYPISLEMVTRIVELGHSTHLVSSEDLAAMVADLINNFPNDLRQLAEIFNDAYRTQQTDYAVGAVLYGDEEEDTNG